MDSPDLALIATKVVWLAFALGAVFGAVARRSHFCTMGAVGDIVTMGDWNRMRLWLLAIAVAVAGTNLLAFWGIIDLSKSLYTASRLIWLSNLTGGLLFGFGMVLAGGCGSKTLIRIGGGSVKSLVVFMMLGLSAFMTLKGVLAVPRVYVLEPIAVILRTTQDLPSIAAAWLGHKQALQLLMATGVSALILLFVFAAPSFRTTENILAGIAIGGVIVAAWFVSGKLGYVAEDPNTLQEAFVATNSGKMESFSFVAPFAYTLDLLMMWTDKSKAVSFGVAAALGMIAGSAAYALLSRSFRWEGFGGVEDTVNHLMGAALMGFGGVVALGCTIGQGLSGVSTLSLGSMLTVAAIISGAIAAFKYQTWRLTRST
ncbi:MAG TPA: transporter [Oxalobacteraceae bacterium]|jgi:uncharacterized membrane protein YedE/YeeE|nr:transporter [Oxalobacteraceae bacterium]